MKKITIAFFSVFVILCFPIKSQTFSTGLLTLATSPETYAVKIDVTEDLVTLTLIGPANRWLGLGFGTDKMISGNDVVIYDGNTLTDRYFGFEGLPPGIEFQVEPSLDIQQDWVVVSDEVAGNVRTLVSTRDRDTGDENDYVFTASADSSIQLVWSHSNTESFVLEWHGGNRGATLQTLSTVKFQTKDFSITPNPAKNRLNIILPTGMANAKVSVFDVLGKMVYSGDISNLNSSISVTNWNSGVYLVKVTSNDVTQTKRFIKQ